MKVQVRVETYQGKLEENLPNPKVIKPTVVTSSGEEILQITIFAELCLDVEMVLGFP